MVILQQYFITIRKLLLIKILRKSETYDTIPIPKHYLWE